MLKSGTVIFLAGGALTRIENAANNGNMSGADNIGGIAGRMLVS